MKPGEFTCKLCWALVPWAWVKVGRTGSGSRKVYSNAGITRAHHSPVCLLFSPSAIVMRYGSQLKEWDPVYRWLKLASFFFVDWPRFDLKRRHLEGAQSKVAAPQRSWVTGRHPHQAFEEDASQLPCLHMWDFLVTSHWGDTSGAGPEQTEGTIDLIWIWKHLEICRTAEEC